MPQKQRNYKEGDWFAVPLENSIGYGIGRIARIGKKGITLGYFFGPVQKDIPPLDQLSCLTADQAILIRKFGDLGLIDGNWIIIGQQNTWHPEHWPVPSFVRISFDGTIAWREEYSDKDLSFLHSTQVNISAVEDLPADGLSASEALVVHLTRLLT